MNSSTPADSSQRRRARHVRALRAPRSSRSAAKHLAEAEVRDRILHVGDRGASHGCICGIGHVFEGQRHAHFALAERRDAVAQLVAVEKHQAARWNLHRARARPPRPPRACAVRSPAGRRIDRSRPAAGVAAAGVIRGVVVPADVIARRACRNTAHRHADRRPATAAGARRRARSSQSISAGERYSSAMNGASAIDGVAADAAALLVARQIVAMHRGRGGTHRRRSVAR